ncbi:MAG: hypothetical protein AAGK37_01070 [Pseudomonadota bacterium]
MIKRVIGQLGCVAALIVLGVTAEAHQLNVFASTDCTTVLVEAKFSTGRRPISGDVQFIDGEDKVLATGTLNDDGTLRVPWTDLDTSTGLLITVSTGAHKDFWIMTPEDIAKKCQS